jgi:hypothetical protein
MILTTNRVGSFDEAFKSRIHLAIKYHELSVESRANLWHSFIASTVARAAPERLTVDTIRHFYPWLTPAYLTKIGEEKLNGRQIKNTVRTAHALAVRAKVRLAPSHIETSLRAMRMFESDFAEGSGNVEEPSGKRRRKE